MKRFLKIAGVLLMFAISLPVLAEKPFYDSKSWIVNVAGDADTLINNGFETKVNKISNLNIPFKMPSPHLTKEECQRLAAEMTAAGIGKKYIDALTDNGKDISYLRQLALANANRNDKEFAAKHLLGEGEEGMNNFIADNFNAILRNNYIVLTCEKCETTERGDKINYFGYAIFQVMVSEEEAYDISRYLDQQDIDKYNKMEFPIKFLYAKGDVGSYREKIIRDISKNVPGLALRGVIKQRNPARISMGEKDGLEKGDVVSIYSQHIDKNGNYYSKRISRARVCAIWDDEAQVNFESGTRGNAKTGDVVVRTPISLLRVGLLATYTPHVWGGQAMMDFNCEYTRAGIIHHFIWELIGFSKADSKLKFIVVQGDKSGHVYRSPFFINSGIGYGLSKTFLGFFDVMPFFLCQFEGAWMTDTAGEDDRKTLYTNTLRVPVGLRFSFNIGYPRRLAIEAGYSPTLGLGDNYKIMKQAYNYIGVKRNSWFVNLGIMF